MSFPEVEREVAKLRQDLAAGRLTEEQFKARLRELMVQDEHGNWWMMGYETGEWYRHDGTDWVRADSPGRAAPAGPQPVAQAVAPAKPKPHRIWGTRALWARWAGTSLSLFVVAWLVPGISVGESGWVVFIAMVIILGFVNAVVRPVLKFLNCPLTILALGLCVLVINVLALWLTSAIAVNWFHAGFYVHGLWSAFLGALIVSIVAVILSAVIKSD